MSHAQQSIFVSTSGIRSARIGEAVKQLADAGFTHIELSGGTKFYPEMLDDLLQLKGKYGLTYRCHNYFPPPKKNFVMNLSSSGETLARTFKQVSTCLDLSLRLGADILGIHAGFRLDPGVDELGQRITNRELLSYELAASRFLDNWQSLSEEAAAKGIRLYIENNVFSEANLSSFGGENPFLLTHYQEFRELNDSAPINLLLDVAHLKVSCRSLALDFNQQLSLMLSEADYVHISDNDGKKDSNGPLLADSQLYQLLQENNLKGKTFTLEVYSGLDSIITSYDNLLQLLD